MPVPLDPLVIDMVTNLDENLFEAFEERAAIIEFDAGLPRAHAECLALLDVLRHHPAALTGVVALQVELSGATQWFLTTDLEHARQHLAQLGAVIPVDLAEVISDQYQGLAILTATF